MERSEEGCDWAFMPCIRLSSRGGDSSVIVSIEDAERITSGEQGLVEGSCDGFFVIEDNIVSLYQTFPFGAISKKPVLTVSVDLLRDAINELNLYKR
ncbi:MAG TPA: hypothetical protein ENN25_01840 [Euryarchaeota archaeon]|nr:hypothetical protein [Euryarchaeota archaeon]